MIAFSARSDSGYHDPVVTDPAHAPDLVVDEVRAVFARAMADFEAAGLTLSNLVKVRFFYTELTDAAAMNQVRNEVYPLELRDGVWPASTGVVTGGRGGSAPRFECQLIAGSTNRAHRSTEVVAVWGESAPKFSHAHESDGLVFISGQGAYRVDGTLLGSDARTQTEGALATFARILAAAGLGTSDLVTVTAYLKPSITPEVELVAELIDEYCRKHAIAPVVLMVPVRELAYGMNIEIEAVAARAEPTFGAISRPSGVFAAHPRSSGAARVRDTVFAGWSGVLGAGTVSDALSGGLEELRARTSALGLEGEPRRLFTIWYSDDLERGAVESSADASLGPTDRCTIVPMPTQNDRSALTVEMIAVHQEE